MALQDIRSRLAGQNKNQSIKRRLQALNAEQIGTYNATHTHGEPDKRLIAELHAMGPAQRDNSLIDRGQAVNRASAPQGEMPAWVAHLIAQQGGLPAVPAGGVPAGVPGTKPVAPGYVPPGPRDPNFVRPYRGGPDNGRPIRRRPGSSRG